MENTLLYYMTNAEMLNIQIYFILQGKNFHRQKCYIYKLYYKGKIFLSLKIYKHIKYKKIYATLGIECVLIHKDKMMHK